MIGILDSGLGGLSVLSEIHAVLPHASFHYVADSQWCPYGTKSASQIQSRVTLLLDDLIARGAQLAVLACNSATIACVESLRATYPLPLIGMEPGVKPAAQKTRTGIVGVLATEASLSGEKFHRLVATHTSQIRVITQSCPRFVSLVESGLLSGPAVEEAVADALRPLLAAGADTIVLGCTHYPFLKPVINKQYPHLTLIDTGPAVAKQVVRSYQGETTQAPRSPRPSRLFSTTGDPAIASALLSTLCPQFRGEAFAAFALEG